MARDARRNPQRSRSPPTSSPPTAASAAVPSKVRPEQVEALVKAGSDYLGTSHRQARVRFEVGALRNGLAELLNLPDGYEILLGNGGTTCFWDAASFGLVEQRSQHLSLRRVLVEVRRGARQGPPPRATRRSSRATPAPTPRPPPRPASTPTCLTHNETSTGVAMTITRPAGTAADEALVLVDATSAPAACGSTSTRCDVYYFAPQKCLAADGGLWLAAVSPAAIERIERIKAGGRWCPAFLDLGTAVEQSRLDQTSNTPALATMLLAREQVDWMCGNGGLQWAASRCDTSAAAIYGWADGHALATPFVTDPAQRSHVVATIDLDDSVDATVVSQGAAGQRRSSTPTATASWAATSCASPCSRPSIPTTSSSSPRASTTSWRSSPEPAAAASGGTTPPPTSIASPSSRGPIEPERLARHLPPAFAVDDRDGPGYLSVVPFLDRRFHFRAAPFPTLSCGPGQRPHLRPARGRADRRVVLRHVARQPVGHRARGCCGACRGTRKRCPSTRTWCINVEGSTSGGCARAGADGDAARSGRLADRPRAGLVPADRASGRRRPVLGVARAARACGPPPSPSRRRVDLLAPARPAPPPTPLRRGPACVDTTTFDVHTPPVKDTAAQRDWQPRDDPRAWIVAAPSTQQPGAWHRRRQPGVAGRPLRSSTAMPGSIGLANSTTARWGPSTSAGRSPTSSSSADQ